MLLLINRRYPALGAVLSVIAAVGFMTIGVVTSQWAVVAMGVLSVVISIARTGHRRRSDVAQAGR
jgi:uncharacterized membrane protein